MNLPTIVSIQSQLVFGCAGNNAAVPLLQRLGATVYAVPTTLLSNTPHYPTIAGGPLDPALIEELLARLLDRIAATDIDTILTGYIGDPSTAEVVARFIDRVRAVDEDVVTLCDPVMGDDDLGMYVSEEIASAITDNLVPRADILTPNRFEAAIVERSGVLESPIRQAKRPGKLYITTGISAQDGGLITELTTSDARTTVETPQLDARPTGTGDVSSAAFLHRYLGRRCAEDAVVFATEVAFNAVEHAHLNGLREMEPLRIALPDRDAAARFKIVKVCCDPADVTAGSRE